MRAWPTSAAIGLLLLAGCASQEPSVDPPAPVANPQFVGSGTALELDGCIGTHVIVDVELGKAQDRLPDGYEPRQGVATARATLTTLECEAASLAGQDLGPTGLGWTQMFLSSAHGQAVQDAGFLFELVTDSPVLASGLRGLGWEVLDGTFATTDTSTAMAAPGVDYAATLAAPAPVGFTYASAYYQQAADGQVRVVAVQGTVTEAAIGGGILEAKEGAFADLALQPGAPHAAQPVTRFNGGFRLAFDQSTG